MYNSLYVSEGRRWIRRFGASEEIETPIRTRDRRTGSEDKILASLTQRGLQQIALKKQQ